MKKKRFKFSLCMFLVIASLFFGCGCTNQETEKNVMGENEINEVLEIANAANSGTLSKYLDKKERESEKKATLESYEKKITNALKKYSIDIRYIVYSKIDWENIVVVHCGKLDLEYEKIYKVIQDIVITPDIILVSSDGHEYRVSGTELLKNENKVWEKELPDRQKEMYRRYFQEGLCSYGTCENRPYEDKYYCMSHCCLEEGCKLPADSIPNYCETHNCDYPNCGISNSVKHHGDGVLCELHKGKPWPSQY